MIDRHKGWLEEDIKEDYICQLDITRTEMKWRCLRTRSSQVYTVIQVLKDRMENNEGGGALYNFSIFLCCLYACCTMLKVFYWTNFFVESWTFILGIKERFQDKNCHFAISIRSHLMILKPAAC